MRRLTVLYDARCAFCRRARAWLIEEPKYVDIDFVPAGGEEARRRFPSLNAEATTSELTVVADDGGVYRNDKAFLMCLWALRRYRGWSLRLASPEALPYARRFFHWFSENRTSFGAIGHALRLEA